MSLCDPRRVKRRISSSDDVIEASDGQLQCSIVRQMTAWRSANRV